MEITNSVAEVSFVDLEIKKTMKRKRNEETETPEEKSKIEIEIPPQTLQNFSNCGKSKMDCVFRDPIESFKKGGEITNLGTDAEVKLVVTHPIIKLDNDDLNGVVLHLQSSVLMKKSRVIFRRFHRWSNTQNYNQIIFESPQRQALRIFLAHFYCDHIGFPFFVNIESNKLCSEEGLLIMDALLDLADRWETMSLLSEILLVLKLKIQDLNAENCLLAFQTFGNRLGQFMHKNTEVAVHSCLVPGHSPIIIYSPDISFDLKYIDLSVSLYKTLLSRILCHFRELTKCEDFVASFDYMSLQQLMIVYSSRLACQLCIIETSEEVSNPKTYWSDMAIPAFDDFFDFILRALGSFESSTINFENYFDGLLPLGAKGKGGRVKMSSRQIMKSYAYIKNKQCKIPNTLKIEMLALFIRIKCDHSGDDSNNEGGEEGKNKKKSHQSSKTMLIKKKATSYISD